MARDVRRATRILLAPFLLCASLTLHAERLPIRAYSTADGLPDDSVARIVTDPHGFLWFCTKGGLARFDGYSFLNFGPPQGLPAGGVNDLLITRAGDYWVATDSGLVRFRPSGRPMFVSIPSPEDDGLVRTITVLREGSDGTIWVGTRKGLYRVETTGDAPVLREVDIGIPRWPAHRRAVAGVTEDRFHTLWIATPLALYRRWPDGSAAQYTTQDGMPGVNIQNVYEDRAGHFWVATHSAGFAAFDADGSHTPPIMGRRFSVADGLPDVRIDQFLEASDGRFWVATGSGLVEFFPHADEEGSRFHRYSERNGLTHLQIYALNEDLDGNLWIASNAGAMKLARDGFTTYGRLDGISNVYAILQDQAGNVCFRGHVLGDPAKSVFEGARVDLVGADPQILTRLGCFDGRRFESFEPDAVMNWGGYHDGTTLRSRNGEFWLGTSEGAFRFAAAARFADIKTARPLALYSQRDGLAQSRVCRLFEDSTGNIWIATQDFGVGGLARWDASDERVRDLTKSPGLAWLSRYYVRSFGEDALGGIWIGFGDGIARYSHGALTTFGAAEGLPAGAIEDIHRDRSGRLWLASERAGLMHVDHIESDHPAFVAAQGLSSDGTRVIAEDRDGLLYVGRGQGIDRFDPATGRVKHFTAADGLIPGLLYAAFTDRDGVLWFGSANGLVRFMPKTERPPVAPVALISGVRVTGIPQFISALGERSISLPAFEPDRNQLQIDFVALDFAVGEVLRYQYKLDGAAGDWSAPSEQRTVNYASLAPGRYTFLVRALNSEGLVSETPATIAFTILRPVWLRWWFLALLGCALTATAYALYRYRVGRLLEVVNIRTRIASDLHDDVGANLTRIAVLSEVARAASGADATDGPLGSIARIARESVSSMSDIVWAIKPERESLLDLTRRMRQHGEELFALRHVDFRFDAPTHLHDNLTLGVGVRRDVLLIFKEAINNAARHSGCSAVEVGLRVEGSQLAMMITDNGAGFDPSRQSDGEGLESMRRRAREVKGVIEIASVAGTGTRIVLTIPL